MISFFHARSPEGHVVSAKRKIGDNEATWIIRDKIYTPIDISALILEHLKEAASTYLGEPVNEAIITVPGYFDNNQKRDTKLAGKKAGFKVLQLLPEPTAAAISYGLDKGKDQTILVYDFGGGTFDISILSVQGNCFKVVAVDGDSQLGGDDFDLLLVDYLIEILEKRTGSDLGILKRLLRHQNNKDNSDTHTKMLIARQRLKEEAERAKIELSECNTTQITIPDILDSSLDEEITLDRYNQMIAPLVDQTISKIHDVLKAARMSKNSIDRVILVGGSTRNRLVKERIAETIKDPWTSERVDEVVSQGAAIVANYLSSPEEDLAPIEFYNVTPFNLGVRASKGGNTDIFEILIPQNSSVPTMAEKEFTTFRRNQKSVEVAVFQGNNSYCTENTFIGGFQLSGIPPAPAGHPKIVVKFQMDNSDLLSVTASCSHLLSEKILDVNIVSREDDLPQKASPQVDIHFLIDTSGSMSSELEGVKGSCLDFANRIVEAGVDCRLGLMDFDLPCDESGKYKWEMFGPMEPSEFSNKISVLEIGRLGGCGCYIGEKNTIPVVKAFADSFKSEDRLKIGILISDEVGNDATIIPRLTNIIKNADICLHVVGVSNSCHERLARETNGNFWDIFHSRGEIDFSNLLDDIAEEITCLALR